MPATLMPPAAEFEFDTRDRETSLERVEMRSGAYDLLLAQPGLEVVEGTVHAGERLTIVPPDATNGGVEAWYVLSGALRDTAGGRRFRAGQLVHAATLAREVILEAEAEVRYLYLSTQPFFHGLSDDMRRLMNLAVEVEANDGYTAEHCLRLQRLSFATGRMLGLDPHRLHLLDYGAYLHDVGKARVPAAILQKPAALTDNEWAVIREHPVHGRDLVRPTFLSDAGAIIEQHHERLDGSGYPYGLARDEILPEASIVAIADAFDAMTTDRSYRRARPAEEAIEELERCAGSHWPQAYVAAFCAALPSVERPTEAHHP